MDGPTAAQSVLRMAGLVTPMALRVAATLGLADLMGSAGATAARLASGTHTVEPALRRLLDHLVTVGVFHRDEERDRYRPTALGEELRSDGPGGIRPLLDINSAGGRAELAFVELLHTVATGEPAYAHRYGSEFWTDRDARPQLRRSFDDQMNWRFRVQATQIAERYSWDRFDEVLDVGGGDGTVLAAILGVHPRVRGRVLDLPPTVATAAERFAAVGLSERAAAVAGGPCWSSRWPWTACERCARSSEGKAVGAGVAGPRRRSGASTTPRCRRAGSVTSSAT